MNITYKHLTIGLLSLVTLIIVSGCANTQSSNLYLLKAHEGISLPKEISPLKGVHIAVERIRIPKYLDRPTIMTTGDDMKLVYSEFRRWGSPIENNISEVLVLNLGSLLPESIVLSSRSMAPHPPDYILHVQIQRLDGELGKEVMLMARWGIFSNDAGIQKYVSGGSTSNKVKLSGDEYGDYVAAINRMITDLSIKIANNLSNMPNSTKTKP